MSGTPTAWWQYSLYASARRSKPPQQAGDRSRSKSTFERCGAHRTVAAAERQPRRAGRAVLPRMDPRISAVRKTRRGADVAHVRRRSPNARCGSARAQHDGCGCHGRLSPGRRGVGPRALRPRPGHRQVQARYGPQPRSGPRVRGFAARQAGRGGRAARGRRREACGGARGRPGAPVHQRRRQIVQSRRAGAREVGLLRKHGRGARARARRAGHPGESPQRRQRRGPRGPHRGSVPAARTHPRAKDLPLSDARSPQTAQSEQSKIGVVLCSPGAPPQRVDDRCPHFPSAHFCWEVKPWQALLPLS